MCEWVCVAAHQWAHNKKFKQHTKALQQQQQMTCKKVTTTKAEKCTRTTLTAKGWLKQLQQQQLIQK